MVKKLNILLIIFITFFSVNVLYSKNNSLVLNESFFKLDTKKPVEISSDLLEINTMDNNSYIFYYQKNVVFIQGENKIYSDFMKIFYNKKIKEIVKAIITGNVKIKNKNILANCKRAFFYRDKNIILLKGNVKVMQQGNVFYGEELIIDMKNNKTVLKGGKKRINTIFSGGK